MNTLCRLLDSFTCLYPQNKYTRSLFHKMLKLLENLLRLFYINDYDVTEVWFLTLSGLSMFVDSNLD